MASVIVKNPAVLSGEPVFRWDAGSVQGVDGLSGRRRESGRVSGAVSERDERGSDCGAGKGAGQPDGAAGMKILIDECAPKALK